MQNYLAFAIQSLSIAQGRTCTTLIVQEPLLHPWI